MEFPDAIYHVTARGNERQPIVREDPDRERFLETLEQIVQRFGVAIHAYCLIQVIPSPWDDLRHGLVLGGESLWNRARELLDQAEGHEEMIRWRRRADGDEVSRLVAALVAQEADRRVALWLRVRVGGQRMTELAKEYGYRDGSGVHRVVHRLAHRLQQLADRVSRVDPMPALVVFSVAAFLFCRRDF
ncbi:MAG: hypothetical protein MUE50_27385 [Pirellulaceae bacterium]|nr:hypothetical protein [Pirellulaceae bacterium]